MRPAPRSCINPLLEPKCAKTKNRNRLWPYLSDAARNQQKLGYPWRASCDQAVCDEAVCDEAVCDEAVCDEAV